MRKRSQRLWFIGAAAALAAGGVALAATALRDTVAFAYTPTEIEERQAARPGQAVRVGGLVEAGSVRGGEGVDIHFAITDQVSSVPVVYSGALPDLFEEGQGVVAEGAFDGNGTLVARRVLARHDETYMPKEAYEALKATAATE